MVDGKSTAPSQTPPTPPRNPTHYAQCSKPHPTTTNPTNTHRAPHTLLHPITPHLNTPQHPKTPRKLTQTTKKRRHPPTSHSEPLNNPHDVVVSDQPEKDPTHPTRDEGAPKRNTRVATNINGTQEGVANVQTRHPEKPIPITNSQRIRQEDRRIPHKRKRKTYASSKTTSTAPQPTT